MQNVPLDQPDQEDYNVPNNAPPETAPSLGTSSDNIDSKSSIGIKPNIAAVISYALVWITGIISNSLITILLGQKIEESSGGRPITTAGIIIIVIISAIISAIITMGAGFIFFLVEKESRFVRLHTMQAILFCVLWFAVPEMVKLF